MKSTVKIKSLPQQILLIGSHQEITEGLAELIPDSYNTEVLVAGFGLDTLVQLQQTLVPMLDRLDLVIINLDSLDYLGVPLIQFVRQHSQIRIIVVNDYNSQSFAQFLIGKGATSYLPVRTYAAEIEDAIRQTLNGENYIGIEKE